MTEPGATFPPPAADRSDDIAAGESGAPATTDVPPPPDVILVRPPRAGELTAGWRIVTAACWIGVAASLAAIWNTSERLGLSTWWLGPRGDPMPVVVRLLPFVAPALMIVAVASNVRWLWRWGVGAALVTAGVGVGDIDGFSGLAGLELGVAAAALVVSLASTTGTYRVDSEARSAAPG